MNIVSLGAHCFYDGVGRVGGRVCWLGSGGCRGVMLVFDHSFHVIYSIHASKSEGGPSIKGFSIVLYEHKAMSG